MSLELVEIKGKRFPVAWLKATFKDKPVLVIKFGHLLGLDEYELSSVLRMTCPNIPMVQALTESGTHSGHLQDYVVQLGYEYLLSREEHAPVAPEDATYSEDGVLAALVEQAQVKVALALEDIDEAIDEAMALMPGKKARLKVKAVLKHNRQTGKIGTVETQYAHGHKPKSLLVFDTSGSMGEKAVTEMVDEVARLAVEAEATLAIVSNTTAVWNPGEFDSTAVLERAEFGGTQYETLAPLFDEDWSVVVTIADYDSSRAAKYALAGCTGRIGLLLDISLVDRPTFLAECLAQLADETRPLLVSAPTVHYDY